MGKDEVQLVNEMIEGVTALIEWEKELEWEKVEETAEAECHTGQVPAQVAQAAVQGQMSVVAALGAWREPWRQGWREPWRIDWRRPWQGSVRT